MLQKLSSFKKLCCEGKLFKLVQSFNQVNDPPVSVEVVELDWAQVNAVYRTVTKQEEPQKKVQQSPPKKEKSRSNRKSYHIRRSKGKYYQRRDNRRKNKVPSLEI